MNLFSALLFVSVVFATSVRSDENCINSQEVGMEKREPFIDKIVNYFKSHKGTKDPRGHRRIYRFKLSEPRKSYQLKLLEPRIVI